MNEKIFKLLAALQAEGIKVILEPGQAVVRVGKVELWTEPGRSPSTGKGAHCMIDGHDIRNLLSRVVVTVDARDITTAEITLRTNP